MLDILCKSLSHGSENYWSTVALRYKVLRLPLKLDYTYSQLINETNDYHLVAILNNEIIACLILSQINDNQIKMRQVAVSEGFQGKGIGKTLVYYSEEFAKEHGYSEILLHARESAVPFYLRLNYQITGTPFIEVGLPHRIMQKKL